MFCDVLMAARIERAECRLVADACANVARRRPGLLTMPVAGGFAAFAEPGSPLNKVVGLGFQPLDEAAWLAVEAAHDARGAPIQAEISTLADPAVGSLLTSRGFRLVGVENVLGRPLADLPPADAGSDLRIVESAAADLGLWMDVVVTGFASPDA